MTKEIAREIVQSSERCTEATLRAFGIEGIVPTKGSGCVGVLIRRGFELRSIRIEGYFRLSDLGKVLSDKRNYLIFTPGHAMAYVGGCLIDTANLPITAKIVMIWEVSKDAL